ncbi:MAG: DNA repair exonuclease [Dehalococcoidia bacterium]|nr:DNA repair exonuclease [Dehalococcoidia bacterium]
MSTVKFVHCADLHLDTPFRGLASIDEERASALNNATFDSYDTIISLAIREQVDFVVIAGDVYDSSDRSLRAQFRFRDGLNLLADHGIRSFVAFGNHDPLSGWSNTLEWPDLSHRFGGKAVDVCQVTRDGSVIASVHGISFPQEAVREDLSARFEKPDPSVPSIAVLHSNVGGDTRHEPYSPATVEALSAKGFTYWALGHVHSRRILKADSPAIVYPGNSQSRHPNETGPKGCCLVTITDGGPPRIRFMPTDTIRYHRGSVDANGCETIDALQRAIVEACQAASESSDGRHLVVRLSVTGRTPLHGELTRGSAFAELSEALRMDMAAREPWIWLEKLSQDTRGSYNLDELKQQQDFAGDIVRTYSVLTETAAEELALLKGELEADVLTGSVGRLLSPLTDEEFTQLAEQAMHQTLDRVVEEG